VLSRVASITSVVCAAVLLAAVGQSHAATTLDATIKAKGPTESGYRALDNAPGEPHIVREEGLARAKQGRAKRRSSLTYFSQLTDPQVADEMSPLRVELLDPAAGEFSAAWRPQEAFGTQVLDQIVRSVNANTTSPVKQGRGGRAKLGFSLLTGDQPDNQQLNEVLWHLAVMEGGAIDPFSGQPISAANPCPGASASEQAALDASVASRLYTGVQDYDDYPGLQAERYQGFWDPDTAPPGGGLYSTFPRYPGLMDRAQQGFEAKGLKVPWYITKGNHDGLIQGNIPATAEFITSIAPGCTKYYPSNSFDPAAVEGEDPATLFADPGFLGQLLAGGRQVPPDPNRRIVSTVEYKELHAGPDKSHGFGYVNEGQNSASDRTASYYAFSPAPGFRFIGLDTVAIGGGANGNVDDPQYRWLENELDRASSVSYNQNGKLVRDGDKDRLIVLFGHHTIATMDNATPDEDAGPCGTPPQPGCDADPRLSTPLHLGRTGKESIRKLLFRYPNVVAAVTGHTHHNDIVAHKTKGRKRGFWELNTASHVDYPQQSRLIEVMDNADGTLSIFGTIVDQASPAATPKPGPAAALSDKQLASLSRRLAASDPQTIAVTSGGGPGKKNDRNVELLIKDPRRLWPG